METLGKLTLFILLVIGAFFTSLLATHIIISVANLYALSFISGFSFVQIYGVLTVLSIATYRHRVKKEREEEPTTIDIVWELTKEVFTKVFFLLVSWGMAFLTFSILT